MSTKRRAFSDEFKAKVALEALKEQQTEVVPKNWTGVLVMKYPARKDQDHVDKTPCIFG